MESKSLARTLFVVVMLAAVTPALATLGSEPSTVGAEAELLAQAGTTEQGRLEPRYQPVPPEPKSSYNSNYLFSITRGVADSTLHPAAKAPMFLFTVPLDILLLPATLIGGFFG